MSDKLKPLAPNEVRCRYCGRIGTRGFLNAYGRFDGTGGQGWYCENSSACERRQKKSK